MRGIRRAMAMAAAAGVVIAGLALPADASTTAYKRYSWNKSFRVGDCWMYGGASWTLYPDGTADFDGRLFSVDDDDAWLMWAHLKDASGAILEDVQVSGSTSTKFVKNIPAEAQTYRWFAKGHFNPALYPLIKGMSLSNHC
ncbi:DUF6294 family protein [Nonomuraea sp. NPDC050556]|uniref:DUF6294 family protein n=1 Tax=Nonomuraea sp. NPDC050556 TaxID=3364369 RepID=UPI00379A9361